MKIIHVLNKFLIGLKNATIHLGSVIQRIDEDDGNDVEVKKMPVSDLKRNVIHFIYIFIIVDLRCRNKQLNNNLLRIKLS